MTYHWHTRRVLGEVPIMNFQSLHFCISNFLTQDSIKMILKCIHATTRITVDPRKTGCERRTNSCKSTESLHIQFPCVYRCSFLHVESVKIVRKYKFLALRNKGILYSAVRKRQSPNSLHTLSVYVHRNFDSMLITYYYISYQILHISTYIITHVLYS
jgi:hypothetical protein